ncbi:MAG TPA: hypothetical protein DDY78_10110 [Planctomycetales bacterium]|nr:hypothetical protein [Planctomycetales bacterium]
MERGRGGVSPPSDLTTAHAPQRQDHAPNSQESQDAAQAHEVHDRRAVFSLGGVVMKAEEQRLIDDRADFVVRRLHQTQLQVTSRIFDVQKVAIEFTDRGKHHDAAGVRELLVILVVGIAETDGVGQPVNGFFIARQEVPARLRVRPAIALHVRLLLGRRQFRAFARVKADGYNLEVLAGRKRHIEHGSRYAVENLVAEHGTAIPGENKDNRLAVEVVVKVDLLAGLVAESEIERNLLVDALIETDAA